MEIIFFGRSQFEQRFSKFKHQHFTLNHLIYLRYRDAETSVYNNLKKKKKKKLSISFYSKLSFQERETNSRGRCSKKKTVCFERERERQRKGGTRRCESMKLRT